MEEWSIEFRNVLALPFRSTNLAVREQYTYIPSFAKNIHQYLQILWFKHERKMPFSPLILVPMRATVSNFP